MFARIATVSAVVVLGLGLQGALAADRYVEPDGNDDENSCLTPADPCATITHAISRAEPGDVIRLAGGFYTESNVVVDRSVIIQGDGEVSTFIQAGPDYEWWEGVAEINRVLFVVEGAEVVVRDATIRFGCAYGDVGSGVYNEGRLELVHVSVRQNGGYFCDGGGGLFNSGTLVLEHASVTDNFSLFISSEGPAAAGVENTGRLEIVGSKINRNHTDFFGDIAGILNHASGTVEVVASEIDENGTGGPSVGGIYNMGTMTLERSSVSTNYSRDGGPVIIFNRGDLSIRQSLIKDNVGYYTAVHNAGTLQLENSTISGNESDSEMSGIVNSGTLHSTNNTIANNRALGSGPPRGSSGITNYGEAHLTNTLVAGNHNELGFHDCTSGSAPEFNDAPIRSYGYNLIGDPTGCAIIEIENAGTDVLGADAMMEPLADNGGHGDTHALAAGSPAVDAIPIGVNGCGGSLNEDQRGFARPSGSACDVGAFELQIEAVDLLEDLIAFIETLSIPYDVKNALISGLRDALERLQRDEYAAARVYFTAFIQYARLLCGGGLSPETAEQLIDEATYILAVLDAETDSDTVGSEHLARLGSAEPSDYRLDSNYPNPFNPTTQIPFRVPVASHVTLVVFDVMGREIGRLADGPFSAGEHEIAWNASGLPSGAYVYRMESGEYVETRQMTLLK